MHLKRVEVIADDEDEIIEAARRMSKNYDFVVTSGGIGPTYGSLPASSRREKTHKHTHMHAGISCGGKDLHSPGKKADIYFCRHDDITYTAIAKAFNLELKLHEGTVEKMKKYSRPHKSQPNFSWDTPSPALTAKYRMAQLPIDPAIPDDEQVIFVKEDLWVPIAVVNRNVHILPGVPRIFETLLQGMKPRLLPRLADPEGKGSYRVLFSTPLAESEVAGYLTELAAKVEPKGIKVGSYPRWGKNRNVVTLVGKDREYMDSLEDEVAKGVKGLRVSVEGEDDTDDETDVKKDKDA